MLGNVYVALILGTLFGVLLMALFYLVTERVVRKHPDLFIFGTLGVMGIQFVLAAIVLLSYKYFVPGTFVWFGGFTGLGFFIGLGIFGVRMVKNRS